MRVSPNFCLGWPQIMILMISTSWVARITGIYHHAQQLLGVFLTWHVLKHNGLEAQSAFKIWAHSPWFFTLEHENEKKFNERGRDEGKQWEGFYSLIWMSISSKVQSSALYCTVAFKSENHCQSSGPLDGFSLISVFMSSSWVFSVPNNSISFGGLGGHHARANIWGPWLMCE
jgi:hypothetical protein